MTQISEQSFTECLDAAIRKLTTMEHFGAGSIVSMPVLYPSGASVVLEISQQAGAVFVSDRGGGYQEAEFIGAIRQYHREAERMAMEAGILFDGRDMFVSGVPIDRIDGAMTVVAAASAHAAGVVATKVAERRERYAKEAMFEKLEDVFGASSFERDFEFIGASNHKWRVDAFIAGYERQIVFNSVINKYNSATGTAAKFYDLGRLEMAPRRIAVVASLAGFSDWYGLVSGTSDAVLELASANDQYRRAKEAA